MATVTKMESLRLVAGAVELRVRAWEMSTRKAGDDAPNLTDLRLSAQLDREA